MSEEKPTEKTEEKIEQKHEEKREEIKYVDFDVVAISQLWSGKKVSVNDFLNELPSSCREYIKKLIDKKPHLTERLSTNLIEHIKKYRIENPYIIMLLLVDEEDRQKWCKELLMNVYEAIKPLLQYELKGERVDPKMIREALKIWNEIQKKLPAILAAFIYTVKPWARDQIYIPIIEDLFSRLSK